MIVSLICFIAGTFFGMVMTALFVAAEDADRCDDCVRMREEIENERSNYEADKRPRKG